VAGGTSWHFDFCRSLPICSPLENPDGDPTRAYVEFIPATLPFPCLKNSSRAGTFASAGRERRFGGPCVELKVLPGAAAAMRAGPFARHLGGILQWGVS